MKKKGVILPLALSFVLRMCFAPSVADGFNDNAHKAISTRAIQPDVSKLDNFLKTVLGFEFNPDGILTRLDDGKDGLVQEKIAKVGAVDEDWLTRPIHHFHNPTKPWNQAGLWLCSPVCESSIVWSQDQSQFVGGKHSWYDARKSYYDALTATSKSDRKKLFAETFTSLGHLIHLVQDAAVPAHTRDDAHPSFSWLFGLPNPDEFHFWAEENQAVNMISGLTLPSQFSFPKSFLGNQPSDNPSYPIPTARLTDTSAGDLGAFPYETTSSTVAIEGGISVSGMSFNRGLAEYSSGHFFSQDTIFPETLQFPGLSNIQLGPNEQVSFVTKWGSLFEGEKRYFYFKPGFGDTDYKLAQGSSLRLITGTNVPTDIGFDPIVYADYGRKLFPRAVVYSAGMIDYFFRGKIDTSPSASTDYLWTPFDQRPSSIRVDQVSVGVDGGNEQGGQGTMRLVLLFRGTDADPSETFPPVIVSQPVSVSASSSPQTVIFPFDSLPFPQTFPPLVGTYSAEYWAIIVYRGPLGQESDAVIGAGYCIDPNDGSRYNRRYDFEHLHGYNPFEGGGGPDVHIAYVAWC